MNREFLTWAALEVWYHSSRIAFMQQGLPITREEFIGLLVMPLWTPAAAARMFALGADFVDVQVMVTMPMKPPLTGPNWPN